MDREQVVRELTDPQAIRQRFFESLRIITEHYRSQSESLLHNESPEFGEYQAETDRLFAIDPNPQQILRFTFWVIFAFLDAMAENNRKFLSLILADYTE